MDTTQIALGNVQDHMDMLTEMEVIPIARVLQGLDYRDAKRIDFRWCIRPATANMYTTLANTKDENEVITAMMQFYSDPMVQKVWQYAQDYKTRDMAEKMKTEWQSRTEKLLLQQFVAATKVKDKVFALDQIKAIYADRSEEVYIPDYDHPSPNMRFFFEIDGVQCVAQGDITAVKGKAKGGKSTFLKLLTAAAISDSGQCCGLSRGTIEGPDGQQIMSQPLRVLYFDTEQSKCTTDKMLRHVIKMAELPHENTDRLRVVNTRRMKTKNRLARFEEELATGTGYDLVILDGVKDIVRNINDPEETDVVVQMLLTIAQDRNIALIVVLHENPGQDTDKMRGWLGTEITNKAFMVWQVSASKTKGKYNIKSTECREMDPPDYAYKWNDDGEIERTTPDDSDGQGKGQKPTRYEIEVKDWVIFAGAWEGYNDMMFTKEELINTHLRLGTLKEGTCKNRTKEFYNKGYIKCDSDFNAKGARFTMTAKGKETLSKALETTLTRAIQDAEEITPSPIVPINSPIWSPNENDDNPPF